MLAINANAHLRVAVLLLARRQVQRKVNGQLYLLSGEQALHELQPSEFGRRDSSEEATGHQSIIVEATKQR